MGQSNLKAVTRWIEPAGVERKGMDQCNRESFPWF